MANKPINSRDDFIAALIAELQSQKDAQGNKDNFFTGNRLTGTDVYRKLCFDYPVVDDDGLQIFYTDLKSQREAFSDGEFWQTVSFSDKVLENIAYFCTSCVDKSVTTNTDKSSVTASKSTNDEHARKKDILSFIASEVYLLWPNAVLQYSQKNLEHLFRYQLQAFSDQLDDDHELMQEIAASKKPSTNLTTGTSWNHLLKIFRNYLVKGTANLLGPILTEEVIGTSQCLKSILAMIKSFKALLEPSQTVSATSPATNKGKSYKHLLDYITQTLAKSFPTDASNNTTIVEDEMHEYEQVLAMVKEIYSHLIFLLVDLLTRFPKSLASHITLLCYILLYEAPKQTSSTVKSPEKKSNEMTIESLLGASTSTNTNTNTNTTASSDTPSLPSLSHYLCMLALSNIQQHLTKECAVSIGASTASSSSSMSAKVIVLQYRPVYEAIRKYFVNNPQSFTLLVTVCEQIAKVNNHAHNSTVKEEEQEEEGAETCPNTVSEGKTQQNNSKLIIPTTSEDTLEDTLTASTVTHQPKLSIQDKKRNRNATENTSPIDIQSSHFYLDLANFLIMKERSSYYANPTLMALLPPINTLMLSSQLVHHILSLYVHLLDIYYHQNTTTEHEGVGNVSEYWSLLSRCNECILYMILFHQSYGPFILQYAPLLPAIQRVLYDYWRNVYTTTTATATTSTAGTKRVEKYMIWSPFSALSILIALKYVTTSTGGGGNESKETAAAAAAAAGGAGNVGSLLRSYLLTCMDICKQSIQEIDSIVIEEVPFSTEVTSTTTTTEAASETVTHSTGTTMESTTTTATTTAAITADTTTGETTVTTMTTATETMTMKTVKKADYQQRLHHQQLLLDSYVTFLQQFTSSDVIHHHLYVPIPGTMNTATNTASQNLRKFHDVIARAIQELYQLITKKRSALMDALHRRVIAAAAMTASTSTSTSATVPVEPSSTPSEQVPEEVDGDSEDEGGDGEKQTVSGSTGNATAKVGKVLQQQAPSNEEDHVLIGYYDRIIKLSKIAIPLFQGQQDSNKAD